jgi:hypothetical protein
MDGRCFGRAFSLVSPDVILRPRFLRTEGPMKLSRASGQEPGGTDRYSVVVDWAFRGLLETVHCCSAFRSVWSR